MNRNSTCRLLMLSEFPQLQTTRSQFLVGLMCVGSWIGCRLTGVPVFPYGVLIPLLVLAVLTDLLSRRIPNWLTYSAAVLALSGAGVVSLRWLPGQLPSSTVIDFVGAITGFTAAFGVMLMIYCIVGVGAGDVKLAGAVGACLGVQSGLMTILWAHLIAGVGMAVFFLWKAGPRRILQHVLSRLFPDRVPMPSDFKELVGYPVPMAVFFALGTIAVLLEVPLP